MITSTLSPESQDRAQRAPGKRAGSFSRQILLDFFLVFLYAAILIRPYFKAKYEDKWGSIESTFISDARFLAAHWPHPQDRKSTRLNSSHLGISHAGFGLKKTRNQLIGTVVEVEIEGLLATVVLAVGN